MTSVLAALRRERSKIKKSMGTGKGADEVYRSGWFAFESLQFIWDKNQPRETANTIETDHQTNAIQQNEVADELLGVLDSTQEAPTANASTSERNIPPPRKAKKRSVEDKRLDTAFKLLTSCAATSVDISDECFDFGNLVAKKLRCYDRIKRSTTMHAIMGIFLNNDMAMDNTHMQHQQISYNNLHPGHEKHQLSTYVDSYQSQQLRPNAALNNSLTSANSAPATPQSSEMHFSDVDVDEELNIIQLI
ncbi:hypothetical protein FQR65_LT17165 [Abscondita terminalis]|nr:hypothetical protein FQR65_LT17165 [Abscondita terminalis]